MFRPEKYFCIVLSLLFSHYLVAQKNKLSDLLIGNWEYEKFGSVCDGKTDFNTQSKRYQTFYLKADGTFIYENRNADSANRILEGKWLVNKTEVVFSDYQKKGVPYINLLLPFKIIFIGPKQLVVKAPLVIERPTYPPKHCQYRDYYRRID